MNSGKLAISMPGATLKRAKKAVAEGRAKSLSAFITEAVDKELDRNELTLILDEMDTQHGKPRKAATRWAKRVLSRSF